MVICCQKQPRLHLVSVPSWQWPGDGERAEGASHVLIFCPRSVVMLEDQRRYSVTGSGSALLGNMPHKPIVRDKYICKSGCWECHGGLSSI